MAVEEEMPGGRAFTDMYSIARGGRLYDKWFAENEAGKPTAPNPAYPPAGVASGKKGADWRCKECHGWDYMGNRGVYAEGEHRTGFPGIDDAYRITPNQMARILSDRSHGYTPAMLSRQDIRDLTAFTARGVIPMDHYIERETGIAKGNARRGKDYYQTVCAGCHGLDGKGEETPPLGAVARDNPWEVLHKILNGQPGEEMPALRAFGAQSATDILAYMQRGLPKK
jgi:thiosulfate dehydrogenase